MLLIQNASQQALIGSVCFYAPMGMLPLGRDLMFYAEDVNISSLDLSWTVC